MLFAVVVCAAMGTAGCGSSGKTPAPPPGPASTTTASTSTGPPIATTGTAGTVGPAASARYNATKDAVLFHIKVALVRFFTSKGFSGVVASCKGINPTTASCSLTGTNKANQTSSAVLRLSVSQSNGLLRITDVSS